MTARTSGSSSTSRTRSPGGTVRWRPALCAAGGGRVLRPRNVHRDRRALAEGAVDRDGTLGLLDEPVDGAQAEAGAATELLGGEEGLEGALLRFGSTFRRPRRKCGSRSGRRSAASASSSSARMSSGTAAQYSVRKLSLPPSGIASRALIAMLSSADSSCPGSASALRASGERVDLDRDALVERTAQHVGQRLEESRRRRPAAGWSTWRRENASSLPVSSAPRREARAAAPTSWRA